MDFDGLVDRYEKPIYNLIYRLIGDPDEAADLTQETFVSAYRSFSQFRSESGVFTWLYRIAINQCKNAFKARERRGRIEGPSLDAPLDDDLASRRVEPTASQTPESHLQRKELKDLVERAISRLPSDYRIVAVLRDVHGLTYREVAEASGLSIDVVRTRLARARALLRQKLEPYFVDQA